MSDVEELKSMLEGEWNKSRFDSILTKYAHMVPWLVLDLPPRVPMFRGRIMSGNDLLYMHRCELSYPPKDYAPIGRVSHEHHPMFYASILPGDKGGGQLPWLTIIEELEIFQGNDERKDITFGIWESHRQLRLAALPFSNQYQHGLVDEIANIQKEWESKVKPFMTPEEIELATFFSDLLVLPGSSKLYQFTAGFFEFFLQHSDEGRLLDGVIYLSAPSQGKGLNVCLKPEVADLLELKNAFYTIFYKKEKEITRIIYLEADISRQPWKWYISPYNGVDKLPLVQQKQFKNDNITFGNEVSTSCYNRGRTKLIKNHRQ